MQAARELEKASARYKQNYDASLPTIIPDLLVGGHLFVRVERPDGKMPESKRELQRRHKLSPVVCGPFEIMELDSETVVIRRADNVERISRDRVVNTNLELQAI